MIETQEFNEPAYQRNDTDRCYHCKTELYSSLVAIRPELEVDVIVSGANTDDLGDYRPGLLAAAEHEVRHPLQECGLGKASRPRAGAGLGSAHVGQAGQPLPVEPGGLRRGSDAWNECA